MCGKSVSSPIRLSSGKPKVLTVKDVDPSGRLREILLRSDPSRTWDDGLAAYAQFMTLQIAEAEDLAAPQAIDEIWAAHLRFGRVPQVQLRVRWSHHSPRVPSEGL